MCLFVHWPAGSFVRMTHLRKDVIVAVDVIIRNAPNLSGESLIEDILSYDVCSFDGKSATVLLRRPPLFCLGTQDHTVHRLPHASCLSC